MSKPTLILGLYASGLFDDTSVTDYYNLVDASYPISPLVDPSSMATSKAKIIQAINDNPGKFALAGMSFGAWVVSEVYKELDHGSLTSRKADFLGAVVAGNPARQAGHTVPNGFDPGGHGILDASSRMTNTPANWYEFAAPGDIIAVTGDDETGLLQSAIFDWLYANYTGAGNDLIAAANLAFASTPQAQVASITNLIQNGINWGKPHLSYESYQPISGDPRSCLMLAADYLVELAQGVGIVVDGPVATPGTRATLFTFAATGAATFRPVTGDYGQFDMQVGEGIDPHRYNVVEVDYPGAHMSWDGLGTAANTLGYTLLQGVEQGAQRAIHLINNTAGKFAFSAYSLGAVVAAQVYNEIRYGTLQHRQDDFVGAVTFGSSVREAGHTIPGGTDPGGHGCFGSEYRLKGTESKWWDFANVGPADPFTTVGDGTTGLDFTAIADGVLNNFQGQDSFVSILQGQLSNDLTNQIPAVWEILTELIFPFVNPQKNVTGHGDYGMTYTGLPHNTLSAVQLAINYLNTLVPEVLEDRLAELDDIENQVESWRQQLMFMRMAKPMITFYRNREDGTPGLEYYGRVDYRDTVKSSFPLKKNVSQQGVLELRFDHYISEWLRTVPNDDAHKKNIVIRVDMFGGALRWTGLLHHAATKTNSDGVRYSEFTFNDDLQFLSFLLGPPNPALPIPVLQWPRVLPILGPAKWACSIMVLINLIRKEGNLWTLPDDPYDQSQWLSLSPTEWETWQCHIKCSPLGLDDSSLWTVLGTRMNPIDAVLADALDDAQLTIRWRRVFSDEGESESGLLFVTEVANGALVFEIVDDSNYFAPEGTFLGGTIVDGMARSFVEYVGGFIEDTGAVGTDNESYYPDEYYQQGWLATLAKAPWLVIRDSSWTPVNTYELTWSPATAVSVVVGGDNPAADAIVRLIIETTGNLLGYFLMGGFSSAGTIAADIIMPFIQGTIAAWLEWKNTGRAQNLGWVHLWELYQQGAENNSWSLSALAALRGGFLSTKSETSHTLDLNGYSWVIPGAHFQIGSRVGSTCRGYDNLIFINQVEEITVSWDNSAYQPLSVQVKIGQNKAAMTPGERMARLTKKIRDITNNIGVHLLS